MQMKENQEWIASLSDFNSTKMHVETSEENLISYSVWDPFHSLSNVKLLDLWFWRIVVKNLKSVLSSKKNDQSSTRHEIEEVDLENQIWNCSTIGVD